jgi:S1-C subfamily serine protease
MGRWVLYFSVCGMIFQAPAFSFTQPDWAAIVVLLERSVVYIQTAEGGCSGFVINDVVVKDKDDRDYIATAAHCDGTALYADNVPAKVIFKDTKKDLMVLEVDDLKRPALKLATQDPRIGDAVGSYGFGYAWERPMFRLAHIADDKTYVPEGDIGGPFFMLDAAFVGGQSGGPCVNAAGEVVLMVQLASDRVGLGVGAATIKSKIGRFFAGVK